MVKARPFLQCSEEAVRKVSRGLEANYSQGFHPLGFEEVCCWLRHGRGISLMREMSDEGACFTVDVLGEEISSMKEAEFFIKEYSNLIDSIIENELNANISIKPTAFGLLIDPDAALGNIEGLVRKAAQHNMFVRLDMEDHRVTGPTIDVCNSLQEKGLQNVGVVLQGRLIRTLSDINDIRAATGKHTDLCS